jgi:hypothetical protein
MSLLAKLDSGIESTNYDSDASDDTQFNMEDLNFKNPFFSRDKVIINNNYVKLVDLTQREFYYNFSKVYALCLKDNGEITDKFYAEVISTKDLNNFVKNLELVECDIKLLNNPVHKSQVILIDSYYLKLFKNNIDFDEKELIIPLINISVSTYDKYVKQFTGTFKIEDYFAVKIANDFYQNPYPNIHYITEMLKNSSATEYWTKRNNTKLNISNKFINRGFNLSISQRISDIKLKNVLQELNKMPKEGDAYLSYIYRKSMYVDVSSVIKKNGYSLYKIDDSLDITNQDIKYILDNITSEYEFYSLATSLLISKKYCHLVLNNPEFMDKLENWKTDYQSNEFSLIEKYLPAFQYAIGYSWLSLYAEECIKKSKITNDDRFVFTIDQASKLPFYPMKLNNDFRLNPYISMLINDQILDIENNLMGVEPDPNKKMGINSLSEFKRRFNIFTTSDENINIFDGVNMNNLGISGSIIPACVTKYNPLMDKFSTLDRYFNEYYATSDIDIMCNLENDFDYIDKFHTFFNKINENCQKYNSSAEFTNIKIAALIVNESFIRKNIVDDTLTYEFILTNLDNEDVKKKFYVKYRDYKIKENFKFVEDVKWKDEKYNDYFDIVSIDNIRIVFARTKKDWENYWATVKESKKSEEEKNAEDDLEEIEKEYYHKSEEFDDGSNEFIEDENVLFKVFENIKFKVKSPKLNHEFEFFKIKFPTSFFSTVANFHLPCVRGYYDCSQVYLLPSCITAAMTLVNLDYKYFAGSNDPIEIINKYRQRGYSIALNDSEKIRFISYSSKVEKWNKLYGNIDIRDKNNVQSVYGYLSPNNQFFNPRTVIKETFNNLKPVNDDYNMIENYNNNMMYTSLLNIHYPNFKYAKYAMIQQLCDLRPIGKYGYINGVKKWYFDAIYENC